MHHREYGGAMNSQYDDLLCHLDDLGTLLTDAKFATIDNHKISFDYLSYSFESKHHAVIFDNLLALKVRFETQVFSEQSAYFDIIIDFYGRIYPIGELAPVRAISRLHSYDVGGYFDRIVGSFLESSDFYHEEGKVSDE
ncbi:hypothetical protein ABNW71_001475 [Vibrio parahaemolyticus]|nr:hypothetical protein [Vibrio parahaemolyticus]ELK7889364.1 hypothetical protein [Vibrio parahaemolyticus]HCH2591100.1 hypothetical protein [Vibrio parahaemolyticus]